VTLLNPDFYNEAIMPLMAEWAFLWLQKQHLHGIDRAEAVRYMVEGAAPRSEVTARLRLLDAAVTKANALLGDGIVSLPTSGSLTDSAAGTTMMAAAEQGAQATTLQALHRRAATSLGGQQEQLTRSQLQQLLIARESTAQQQKLIDDIHDIDAQVDGLSSTFGRNCAELQGSINAIRKALSEMDNIRDDSLDNTTVVWCSEAFAPAAASAPLATLPSPSHPSSFGARFVLNICEAIKSHRPICFR
jgi:hypothetical protein